MIEVAFKDIDGDMLHISPARVQPYTAAADKYGATYRLEIEMLTPDVLPVIFFTADQLRALVGILTLAAEQLEKKGH